MLVSQLLSTPRTPRPIRYHHVSRVSRIAAITDGSSGRVDTEEPFAVNVSGFDHQALAHRASSTTLTRCRWSPIPWRKPTGSLHSDRGDSCPTSGPDPVAGGRAADSEPHERSPFGHPLPNAAACQEGGPAQRRWTLTRTSIKRSTSSATVKHVEVLSTVDTGRSTCVGGLRG